MFEIKQKFYSNLKLILYFLTQLNLNLYQIIKKKQEISFNMRIHFRGSLPKLSFFQGPLLVDAQLA